ncbi:MAG: MbtH family NRPS accessory protein [Azospirillaceae bacterium]|nr:MbtH family NRPS accessory protein [Azospirillaceae bacterium]
MAVDNKDDGGGGGGGGVYVVVRNDEEQFSIWQKELEIPKGWSAVGKEGLKDECLQHVNEIWTDMRPLSLRKKMEEDAKRNSGEMVP